MTSTSIFRSSTTTSGADSHVSDQDEETFINEEFPQEIGAVDIDVVPKTGAQ